MLALQAMKRRTNQLAGDSIVRTERGKKKHKKWKWPTSSMVYLGRIFEANLQDKLKETEMT